MKARTVSVNNYRDDPLYPRIARSVAAILQNSKVVAPVGGSSEPAPAGFLGSPSTQAVIAP